MQRSDHQTGTPGEALARALTAHAEAHGEPRRLLVGFSGGMDSTVLLSLCRQLAPDRTVAVHVDHGYAAEAARWQAHCRRVCADIGVSILVRELGLSGTVSEREAREARYRAFREIVGADDLLLLAHHRDDQAETLLLHVLQGRGVFGMPASRPLGAGHLLRPLLATPRLELAAEAERLGLVWIDDAGNLDLSFDRNFLRHRVVPLLGERFEHLPERLAGLAERARALERALLDTADISAGPLELARLEGHDPSVRAVLLRLWLSVNGAASPPEGALETFATQLETTSGHGPALELEGLAARRYRGAVHLVPRLVPVLVERRLAVPDELRLPQGTLGVSRADGGFRPDGALGVRCLDGGGRERILIGGRERPVRELLRAAGVPPWLRRGYPLLYDDTGLVAVPGVGIRDGTPSGGDGVEVRWVPATRP